MKTKTSPILITLTLLCFGLLPNAQAVSPAPDGSYAYGNTAEGTGALQNLTTGVWNSAFGYRSLYKNAAGHRNTAVGYQALYNTAGNHYYGLDNVGIGVNALFSNTTGNGNIAIGSSALYHNTTGSNNIAIGNGALSQNPQSGSGNTVIGDSFASDPNSVSVGRLPILVDYRRFGDGVLTAYINAQDDIYIGSITLQDPSGPIYTSHVHIQAQDAVYVGAVYGNPIAGSPVNVASNGQLGVAPSSQRFKDEIKPMDKTSEAIFALKPVSFRYNKRIDPKGIPQFGLVAEEVEAVNSDLVVRDKDGRPYSVRYDQVNAMLLNEFLKEHRKTEKLEATVARQQKQIEALTAGLQKVSAQVEMNRTAPQTVVNSQ